MMHGDNGYNLPISGRYQIAEASFANEIQFLRSSDLTRNSRRTYAGALRLFADWLQTVERYLPKQKWPLPVKDLSTNHIVRFYQWLGTNRAQGTQFSYTAAIESFMWYLDTVHALPKGVRIGALKSELSELRSEATKKAKLPKEVIVDAIEQIVAYYDLLPLPQEGTTYNKRIILLRNRAMMHTLYSTGAQLQNLISLDRNQVRIGSGTSIVFNPGTTLEQVANLSDIAKAKIKDYLDARNDNNVALFVAHSRNSPTKRLSATGVHKVIKNAVNVLELPVAISARHFRQVLNEPSIDKNSIRQVSPEISRMFNQIRAAIRLSQFSTQMIDVIVEDSFEAQKSFANEAYKSCVVMLGAVLEGIMIGLLTRSDVLNHLSSMSNPPKPISSLGYKNQKLADLISTKLSFEDLKNSLLTLVPQIERLQVASLQSFRNHIHPSVALKNLQSGKASKVSRKRAVYHLTSLALISECIVNWKPGPNGRENL